MKLGFTFAVLTLALAVVPLAQAQNGSSQDNQPNIQPRKPPPQKQPAAQPPTPPFPSAESPGQEPQKGESSSKDSQIDLEPSRPPNAGASGTRPAAGDGQPGDAHADDVQELHPYDPHKAEKDIEVAQYYLKHKNYRAALDRFHEALMFKPRDALATFGLAQTQEGMDLLVQAYQNYRNYLEILPIGPMAKEAREAVTRIQLHLEMRGAEGGGMTQLAHDIDVGETYLSQNDFDAARVRFEEAVRIAPEDALANFRMAESLQGLQRLEQARLFYEKYLQLQPEGRHASDAKKAIGLINQTLGPK